MAAEALTGRCGLYCGACSVYRAQRDDGEYLKGLAERFNCPPEKVRCEGCGALTPECWGYDCGIVQCSVAKGYRFCHECGEFEDRTCDKYEKLDKGYLENDNVDIRKNLETIKSGNINEWLKLSTERFRCPNCLGPLPTGATQCHNCRVKFPMV